MCSDDGRAMHSSPLRRQAHRFGRQRTQSAIEFPCYAPQQDGKSTKMTGNLANVGEVLPRNTRRHWGNADGHRELAPKPGA